MQAALCALQVRPWANAPEARADNLHAGCAQPLQHRAAVRRRSAAAAGVDVTPPCLRNLGFHSATARRAAQRMLSPVTYA